MLSVLRRWYNELRHEHGTERTDRFHHELTCLPEALKLCDASGSDGGDAAKNAAPQGLSRGNQGGRGASSSGPEPLQRARSGPAAWSVAQDH